MSDLIDRQAAIDAFLTELTKRERKNLLHTWSTVEVKYFVVDMLEKLPSAQPESEEFEWCTDCKEYDQTAHCCHRFTKVIRQTVEELQAQPKTGKWIPTQNPQWKAYYHDKCSVCGWWNTKNAVCRDSKKKAHSLNYCPNCGARMEGKDE